MPGSVVASEAEGAAVEGAPLIREPDGGAAGSIEVEGGAAATEGLEGGDDTDIEGVDDRKGWGPKPLSIFFDPPGASMRPGESSPFCGGEADGTCTTRGGGAGTDGG